MFRWTTNIPCSAKPSKTLLIAVTGGPGAGKSAVLEFARRSFCSHIQELPEAASIIFGGGFIRKESITAKKAAQRAIFHVQRELEQLVIDEGDASVALCDRGTVDGVAYWPNSAESFWKEMGVKAEEEILRYHAVIHLRPPSESDGYNQRTNVLRIESAHQAELIDQKIELAWKDHPRRFFVESTPRFIDKLVESVKILEGLLPDDCRKSLEQMTKTR